AIGDAAARRRTMSALLRSLKYLPSSERMEQVGRIVAASGMASPRDLMMSSAQLRMLASAGMGIGAHTDSHPILASLTEDEAAREIGDGRDMLEGIVGRRVTLFAYPNGKPGQDYRIEHVRMAQRLGFKAAFTTAP